MNDQRGQRLPDSAATRGRLLGLTHRVPGCRGHCPRARVRHVSLRPETVRRSRQPQQLHGSWEEPRTPRGCARGWSGVRGTLLTPGRPGAPETLSKGVTFKWPNRVENVCQKMFSSEAGAWRLQLGRGSTRGSAPSRTSLSVLRCLSVVHLRMTAALPFRSSGVSPAEDGHVADPGGWGLVLDRPPPLQGTHVLTPCRPPPVMGSDHRDICPGSGPGGAGV